MVQTYLLKRLQQEIEVNYKTNIKIFQYLTLPNKAVKTLKTTDNSGITDTNFKVRRQFVLQLSSGSGQLSAGTNETFASLAKVIILVSITAIGSVISVVNW